MEFLNQLVYRTVWGVGCDPPGKDPSRQAYPPPSRSKTTFTSSKDVQQRQPLALLALRRDVQETTISHRTAPAVAVGAKDFRAAFQEQDLKKACMPAVPLAIPPPRARTPVALAVPPDKAHEPISGSQPQFAVERVTERIQELCRPSTAFETQVSSPVQSSPYKYGAES